MITCCASLGNTSATCLLLRYLSDLGVDTSHLASCHLTSCQLYRCHLTRCQLSRCRLTRCHLTRGHLVRRPWSLGLVITFFLPTSVQLRIAKGGVDTKELGDPQVAVPLAATLLSAWPIARLPNRVDRVNQPLLDEVLAAITKEREPVDLRSTIPTAWRRRLQFSP